MKYHILEFYISIFVNGFKFSYFLLNLIFTCLSKSLLLTFDFVNSSFISTSFPNNSFSPSFIFFSKNAIFCLSVLFLALIDYLLYHLI